MRNKITAANWKMNLEKGEVLSFMQAFTTGIGKLDKNQLVIIAAPYIYLDMLKSVTENIPQVEIYAENIFYENSGAYTGEISAPMLKSINVAGALVGHSERREIFDESQKVIAKKLLNTLKNGMNVIFCCGEPLEIREKNEQNEYILNQLRIAFRQVTDEMMAGVTIAYEPIWAIGTGETATPSQAQEIHTMIRAFLEKKFSEDVSRNTSILYGGSVKSGNAQELFSMDDIDGGLIGGASLNAESFLEIIEIHAAI